MKRIVILLFLSSALFSFMSPRTPGYNVGDRVEDFVLKNVDGKTVSLSDYEDAKGVILIFTCNTCPFAQAYEQRIIDLDKRYKSQGYPVVAINSNDEKVKPEDSYDAMVQRSIDKSYPFPYLRDADQEIAMIFGAQKTPHVYLLKRYNEDFFVEYTGAIDDNANDAGAVTHHYVEDAIAAIEAGKTPDPSTTKAIGCGIKWREN